MHRLKVVPLGQPLTHPRREPPLAPPVRCSALPSGRRADKTVHVKIRSHYASPGPHP
ncbi:hypothetical protein J2X64_003074 [Phycicoccus sp. 3266]|nr:hypothetical protein [Phycicoccus sp. 3266]